MRRFLPSIIVSAALLALAACSVQPLYSVDPATGDVNRLNVPIDNPGDRESQLVRNALLDLTGTADGTGPYTAKVDASSSNQTIFRSNAPDSVTAISNRRITMTATLTLSDAATGDRVAQFTGIGRTFFESSRQEFANDRSEVDANRRAAGEAAQSLRNQLAAYLKRYPQPVAVPENI